MQESLRIMPVKLKARGSSRKMEKHLDPGMGGKLEKREEKARTAGWQKPQTSAALKTLWPVWSKSSRAKTAH